MHYPVINIASPEFKRQSHQIYHCLRKYDPVHQITMPNGDRAWLITTYEHAVEILKDNERLTKNKSSLCPFQHVHQMPPKALQIFGKQLLSIDPPDHTRLRKLSAKAFSPTNVSKMKEEIQKVADQLIDKAIEKGKMDILNDFAFPLPITVISQMLGVPQEDHEQFRVWSEVIVENAIDPKKMLGIVGVLEEFYAYIEKLIEERKLTPTDDFISNLVQAHEGDDSLSHEELLSMVLLLIVAGHETTVNLISNGILALLENKEQLKLFKEDPSLTDSAVEEFLRYYSPVEIGTSRWAKHDFEYGGKQIKMGDLLLVSFASANRDPNQFERADCLDITRAKNKHLAFGNGIHFCLGASLARLEGSIAIRTLFDRIPNIKSDIPFEELQWRPGILMRGLTSFPVIFK